VSDPALPLALLCTVSALAALLLANGWPGTVEMEILRSLMAPANCRRLVHRWRDRQRWPDVQALE
jgi:hypothetical protein